MFNTEFFPTPKETIDEMLRGINLKDKVILEPSAGKGDILDHIERKYNHTYRHSPKSDLYAIELEPDLRHILHEKGYRVIADDFLNYSGGHYFDLIIMNPPFSNADEHILKAWDLLHDGEIVCLLNSETINNPYTQRRQLLKKLIEDFGSCEHIGKPFLFAENTTDVSCCIVRLKKESQKNPFDFDFSRMKKEKDFCLDEQVFKNQIATRDIIGNMILQFEHLKNEYVNYLRAREGMRYFADGLLLSYTNVVKLAEEVSKERDAKSYNVFCDKVRAEIWQHVIKKTAVEKYFTNSVQQNFDQFMKAQGNLEFSQANVSQLITMIFDNRLNIMEQAVIDVFDIFTRYHEENRCHVEGWRTNDKWKVNRKIVLPCWVRYGDYCDASSLKNYGDSFKTNYSYQSRYSDIDKVMCYLTGRNYDECFTIYEALDCHFEALGKIKTGDKFINEVESEFFNIHFFKKGTVHLEFKDPRLWAEFNMRACAGKHWLPEAERRAWEQSREAEKPEPIQYKLIA